MVNSVNNNSLSNAVSSATSNASLDKNAFLRLMIEQLKSQDPLNPTDSTQFTSQLAQFSSLEQLSNINESLQNSINANFQLTQSINNTLAPSLINKSIKLDQNTIKYSGQSNVNLGYELPSSAGSVTINIYDKYGNIVKTINDAENSSGDHKLSWDFTDNNGSTVSSGTYIFKVTATDLNGEDITTNAFIYGQIEAVRYTDNGTKLIVDGFEYDLSDVSEIVNQSDGGK